MVTVRGPFLLLDAMLVRYILWPVCVHLSLCHKLFSVSTLLKVNQLLQCLQNTIIHQIYTFGIFVCQFSGLMKSAI